jgi:hypothetical protein
VSVASVPAAAPEPVLGATRLQRSLGLASLVALPVAFGVLGYTWATQLWHPQLIGHSCPDSSAWSCEYQPLLVAGITWTVLGGLVGLWFATVIARAAFGRYAARMGRAERLAVLPVIFAVVFWGFFFDTQQGGSLTDLGAFLLVVLGAVAARRLLAVLLWREPRSLASKTRCVLTMAWAVVLPAVMILAGFVYTTDQAAASSCARNPVCDLPHLPPSWRSVAKSTEYSDAWYSAHGSFVGYVAYAENNIGFAYVPAGKPLPYFNSIRVVVPAPAAITFEIRAFDPGFLSGRPYVCVGAVVVGSTLVRPVFGAYPVTRHPGTYYFVALASRTAVCGKLTALTSGVLPPPF